MANPFNIRMSHVIFLHAILVTYLYQKTIYYLKFKFHWESYILSGKPTYLDTHPDSNIPYISASHRLSLLFSCAKKCPCSGQVAWSPERISYWVPCFEVAIYKLVSIRLSEWLFQNIKSHHSPPQNPLVDFCHV